MPLWSFGVMIFHAQKSLFVDFFGFPRSACWGSKLVLSQRPPGDAEGTRAGWMNSPGVSVMSGGTSKARETRPDVLSHRIFSRPDQPALQARHSYRNIKGHKCTHTQCRHTFQPGNIHEAQTSAHTTFKKRGDFVAEDPGGLACVTTVHHLSLRCWQGRSLQNDMLACAKCTFLWKELPHPVKPLRWYLTDKWKW